MLKDAGDQMSDADKAPIQSAVDKVKKAREADDLNALRSAFGELEQAAHAMAAAQQSRGQAGGGPGPEGGGPAPPTAGKKDGDDVVDAEFEVK